MKQYTLIAMMAIVLTGTTHLKADWPSWKFWKKETASPALDPSLFEPVELIDVEPAPSDRNDEPGRLAPEIVPVFAEQLHPSQVPARHWLDDMGGPCVDGWLADGCCPEDLPDMCVTDGCVGGDCVDLPLSVCYPRLKEWMHTAQTACSPRDRRWAVARLGRCWPAEVRCEVIAVLTASLCDADWRVRRAAADGLGDLVRGCDGCCPESVIGPLTVALQDPAWGVRRQATQALRCCGVESVGRGSWLTRNHETGCVSTSCVDIPLDAGACTELGCLTEPGWLDESAVEESRSTVPSLPHNQPMLAEPSTSARSRMRLSDDAPAPSLEPTAPAALPPTPPARRINSGASEIPPVPSFEDRPRYVPDERSELQLLPRSGR